MPAFGSKAGISKMAENVANDPEADIGQRLMSR